MSAPGKRTGYVCRTFYPHKLNPEDPVTGASQSFLAPYWAKKLGKKELRMHQLSKRGGSMLCSINETGVEITGEVVLFSEGCLFLDNK